MRAKYFRDTDTALLEFLDRAVEETREINQDVYVDLDADGNVVSMTIEHARRNSQLPDVLVQEFDQRPREADRDCSRPSMLRSPIGPGSSRRARCGSAGKAAGPRATSSRDIHDHDP